MDDEDDDAIMLDATEELLAVLAIDDDATDDITVVTEDEAIDETEDFDDDDNIDEDVDIVDDVDLDEDELELFELLLPPQALKIITTPAARP